MRKDELVRMHALLLQMRRTFEATGIDAAEDLFGPYDRLGVSPEDMDKDRRLHQAAVFLLGEALSKAALRAVSADPDDGQESLRSLREADEEVGRHAHRLLGKRNDLDLRVLRQLGGAPQRYRDLKPLLHGGADNHLTVALERLQDEGLVKRRSDLSETPPVHSYVPTELGKQVLEAVAVLSEAVSRASLAAQVSQYARTPRKQGA